jgi:hypothetical protein
MPALDKRFALIRDGAPWYAARIEDRTTKRSTFRISGNGTQGRFGQAQQTEDLEAAARAVLRDGLALRFAPEGGKANTLYLKGDQVTGWQLDPAIAARLGVAPAGKVP